MEMQRVDPAAYPAADLSFLWLEVTAKCNLECVHCYADSGPTRDLLGGMAFDDWLTILSDAADLGCRQVQFIGGEPTLHPDLTGMISFAAAQNYEFIEVYTNATHIDEQLLRVFTQHRVHVAISFYSDDPETHDAITKRRGSFDHTVRNLRRLLHADLPVRAGVIEMRGNPAHAERARQFLEDVGVSDIKIDLQRGIGRAATDAEQNDPMGELCGECWKGKLCVTSSGAAYPCVFSRFAEVGSARDGIGSIVSDDRLINFRRALRNYQDRNMSKSQGHGVETGCGPDCSPCQPSVFKCVPGKCTPRSAWHSDRQANNVPAETHAQNATSGSAVLGGNPPCAPTCSPTTCAPCGPVAFCAPCAPEDFDRAPEVLPCTPASKCAPDSSRISAGWSQERYGLRDG